MSAYVDYLRLGSWDLKAYTNAASAMMQWRPGWKAGSFLQYHGHKLDSLFFGTAKQREKSHYLIQCSGGLSQTLLDDPALAVLLSHESFYCTRIDLQKTLPLPEWWNVRDIADSLGADGVKHSFIESDTGSTLYVGSRTSDKFIRVYTKSLDREYLRFEYELKGQLARAVFGGIFQDGTRSINAVYNSLLVNQRVPQYLKSYYLDPEVETVDVRVPEKQHEMAKKLEWLLSLEDTIRHMLNDHDIGPETKVFIDNLARYGGRIDLDTAYMLK